MATDDAAPAIRAHEPSKRYGDSPALEALEPAFRNRDLAGE
ncbi:MAG TPA: hypothetical protein VF706_01890 [Solirubrobacteraceae bacterium]